MGMGRLCVMKQTKALQNSVVSMTHLVLSVKAKKLPYLYCIYCSFADKIYCLTGFNIFIFFKVHILFELFELVQKNMQKKLIHILLENSFILRANVETKELTCHIATFSASQIKVKLSLFTFLSAYFCLLVWLLFGLTLVYGIKFHCLLFFLSRRLKLIWSISFQKVCNFLFQNLRLFTEQIHFPGSK